MSGTKTKAQSKRKPKKREQAAQERYEKLNRCELEFFWLATKESLPGVWKRTDKTESEILDYLLDHFAGYHFDEVLETIDEAATGLGKRNETLNSIELILDTIENGGKMPTPAKPKSTGNEHLDRLLAAIQPIDWTQHGTFDKDGNVKTSERDYTLRTIDRVLETATASGIPFVNHRGQVYCYTGTHYKALDENALKTFLIAAAETCGVATDTAIYQYFAEKITRQFYINTARQSGNVAEPADNFINLRNGTLFFNKDGERFEKHNANNFIRYGLDFDYNEAADCPLWTKHIDRSLPSKEKQDYLAECLALTFYKGKIEKAPILYGQPATGKSTTLDVFTEVIGRENVSSETLASLTKSEYTGDYARARLDGKLVNVSTDISRKIGDEGLAKALISRETVAARRPNKEGFDMSNYARLVFAMNSLPSEFFTDSALHRRVAVIEFTERIASTN